MKIILTVTDSRGKNLVFVSDTLKTYSLKDAVSLATENKLNNICAVSSKYGTYLRAKPKTEKKDQLDAIALSSRVLFSSLDDINHGLVTPAFGSYWKLFQNSLKKDEIFIIIDDYPRITKNSLREKLKPHRDLIFAAAKKFTIDPYLLGAIIIDEVARINPIEPITDLLAVQFIGKNTSVGIAQVKIDTARNLIKNGYYNPNPNDEKLLKENIRKTSRSYIYKYSIEAKHSIFLAAAIMRSLIDDWHAFIDLSDKPEIIATLYSLYKRPHSNPQPNERGLQISNEFYQLAKDFFGRP